VSTTAATVTKSDEQIDSNMNSWTLIYRAVERFGLPTILVGVVLWWARTDLIKPLLDAHYEFLGEIRRQGDEHTEKLEEVVGLLQNQNQMLREQFKYLPAEGRNN
jgi:hypothetical protein